MSRVSKSESQATGDSCARSNRATLQMHSSQRPSASVFRALGGALVAALALSACPATSEDVRPPEDEFFFPTGLAITPDEDTLFVANANSDLRFDSGSITPVDVSLVQELFDTWTGTGEAPQGFDCERDVTLPFTLVCNEESLILAEASVRTGNFATEMDVQSLDDGRFRLFSAVRGDPSITWLDFDPASQASDCGGSGVMPRCDDEHRLTTMRDDITLGPLAPEPFGLFVDSANGYVVSTHLIGGAVTLSDAPTNGDKPMLTDGLGNVFEGDAVTRISSALGVAGQRPGVRGSRIYVTSRSEERVQTFTVHRFDDGLATLVPAEFFFLRGVDPSDDGRGIRFSADGNEAYIINRDPPMMQVIDTSIGAEGVPANDLKRAVEVCGDAASIEVADLGRGERVFLSCFLDGQVWVIDPQGGSIDAIVDVGRGPQDLAIAPGRQMLFATNFLEDTVSVIDLRPGSSTENRMVLKLGRTRQSGGN